MCHLPAHTLSILEIASSDVRWFGPVLSLCPAGVALSTDRNSHYLPQLTAPADRDFVRTLAAWLWESRPIPVNNHERNYLGALCLVPSFLLYVTYVRTHLRQAMVLSEAASHVLSFVGCRRKEAVHAPNHHLIDLPSSRAPHVEHLPADSSASWPNL